LPFQQAAQAILSCLQAEDETTFWQGDGCFGMQPVKATLLRFANIAQ
jgi:hypothetical protein